MSKKTLLKGALFLTLAGFATRFLGFYNRIFLTRLIGVNQLGVYQLIFPIYILSYAISSQGISLSLIKNVSYYSGRHNNAACKFLFKAGAVISLLISLACSLILYLAADAISNIFLHNPECTALLKSLCFAIPFIAVKSCCNSYFVGFERPYVQGSSHFYEQLIRIAAAYFIFMLIGGTLSGAQIAIIAVAAGEVFSCMYSLIYYLAKHKEYTDFAGTSSMLERRNMVKILIKDSIPFSINNITITLFSAAEAILLPAMLLKYYNNNSDASLEMYGIISGIVMPFILFPSTITNSISTMLMPSVSHAVAANNPYKIKNARSNTIMFCSALGIAAWIFFALFGNFACRLTFDNLIAGEILSKTGFLCPLLYLASTQSAILNGMGKTYKNLFVSLFSITIRIVIIKALVPLHGIAAYIFAMVLSYALQNALLIILTSVTISNHTESPDKHNN